MLILRKDVKLGLGIGCGLLAIGAVYAGISLLTGGTEKAATDGNGVTAVATAANGKNNDVVTIPTVPAVIDQTKSTAPANPRNDTKPLVGAANDPFAESTRADGDANSASQWDTLLTSGKVETAGTSMTEIARTSTPAGDKTLTKPLISQNSGSTQTAAGNSGLTTTPPLVHGTPPLKTTAFERPAVAAGKYLVQPGDTFSSIAAKLYGSKGMYHVLVKANPQIEPTRLKPNMEINVPSADAVKSERGSVSLGSESEQIIDANRQYKVQSGDTLHGIALRLYGKSAMWSSIYDSNKEKIGPDAGRIKVGMVLNLPAAPSSH